MRRRRAAAEQLPREVLERFLLGVAQLLARRRVEAAAAALGAEDAEELVVARLRNEDVGAVVVLVRTSTRRVARARLAFVADSAFAAAACRSPITAASAAFPSSARRSAAASPSA